MDEKAIVLKLFNLYVKELRKLTQEQRRLNLHLNTLCKYYKNHILQSSVSAHISAPNAHKKLDEASEMNLNTLRKELQTAQTNYGVADISSNGTKDVVTVIVPSGKTMILLGFHASQTIAKNNVWQIKNVTSRVTYGQWVFEGPSASNLDFSTPQIVGVGSDIVKLQIVVSNSITNHSAYGVLRYAFI